ncbi:adenylate kinase [Gemmatimonadota bacterium]
MDNRFVAIMLGPPGAGKGTQAVLVANRYKVPHISTGDILRDNVARETELGLKARSFMEGGDLVPDKLIIELIADRIELDDAVNGFLLDGFPRTLAQAVSLEDLLREREMPIDVVALLDVEDEEIVRRISSRYLCRECKRDANAGQGTISDLCPHCGGELYQREDDKAETVQNRLEVYRRQTAPLVEYYEGKNLLLKVNGIGHVDVISNRLLESLEKVQDPEAG